MWKELLVIAVSVAAIALVASFAQTKKPAAKPEWVRTNAEAPAWPLDLPPSGQTGTNKSPQLESAKTNAVDAQAIYRGAFRDGAYFVLLAATRNPDVHDSGELTRIAWQLRSTVRIGTNQP